METSDRLSNLGLTQAQLAKIIGRQEKVLPRVRVRAHRIWHGSTKPSDEEMKLIVEMTKGRVTANAFYDLPTINKNGKPHSGH